MEEIYNYINGELKAPTSGAFFNNTNPSTGENYSLIPDSDEADVDLAVQSAKAAFPLWSGLSTETRSKYLLKIAELIDANCEELALAECIDNGKPISLARSVDIPRSSANFRFFATAILHFSSESHGSAEAINYTTRNPVGVAGCISPWNLPLYLFTWKIAPALATGNTVVAKPSELTPMTAYLLSKLCIEADLPPGVLNIVHGLGAKTGQAIVDHEGVNMISFTGGTATGKRIAASAAPKFKKLSLELGGKNPNIIFADCDFENAVATTVKSSFSNQGQICLCGSRILVEDSIYKKFKDELISRTSELRIGDPMNDDSQIGALVSEQHMHKVLGYIKLAKEEGGTILQGGRQEVLSGRCENGYFVQPTIIEGLPQDCRTNQEEIFGPVVTIAPFTSAEEAIAMANATDYGLAATIWTNNLKKAHDVANKVDCGIAWVNCWMLRDLRTPFGGMKQSGVGREGGEEVLHFFTEPKNICIKFDG